jgi:uncharacterized YccA/Bax inhibitor family protein
MTINGSIAKTFVLLMFVVASAAYTWWLTMNGFGDKVMMLTWAGVIGGFISALACVLTTRSAMTRGQNPTAIIWLAPTYALFEGLALGGISAMYQNIMNGIVFQAVFATLVVTLVMLVLFSARAIQATDKFRSVILTATLSVAIVYIIQLFASFFGRSIPLIFDNGMVGIGFSLIVIVIAALNLIIDFDFIERAANNLMPKNYEWYGAFGLMVTLIWLYLEMLRLLAKLQSRR